MKLRERPQVKLRMLASMREGVIGDCDITVGYGGTVEL